MIQFDFNELTTFIGNSQDNKKGQESALHFEQR